MFIDPAQVSAEVCFSTLSACLAPRPIVLVTTLTPPGVVNVAPFSMCTLLSASPALLGLCIFPRHGKPKDTRVNIEAGGDFVVNTVTLGMLDQAVLAAADFPPDRSEAAATGLTTIASDLVQAPRLAKSPVSLECRRVDVLRIPRSEGALVIGEIVRIHLDDAVVCGGAVDMERLRPLGHLSSGPCGYEFGTVGRVIRRDATAAVGR